MDIEHDFYSTLTTCMPAAMLHIIELFESHFDGLCIENKSGEFFPSRFESLSIKRRKRINEIFHHSFSLF